MNLPEPWQRRLRRHLDSLSEQTQRRIRRRLHGPTGPVRTLEGRDCLSFASNDYLGLASDPRLIKALANAMNQYGLGSGSAQHLGGHTTAHAALEERLADWLGQSRALLFSSGYMANLGLIGGLLGRHDQVLMDRYNHASLIDAARLSRASLRRYRHLDVTHLDSLLEANSVTDRGLTMISTESVFSMDGDVAPIAAIKAVADQHQALMAVDEAHALGVLGPTGGGHLEELGMPTTLRPAVTATFGKSLGTFGAFVAGDTDLIETLLQSSRTALFTTAAPAALMAATLVAVELVINEGWRREVLNRHIERFRVHMRQAGLTLAESRTPIQLLHAGDNQTVMRWSAALLERGLLVPAIRPPTVPADSARLRISLSAAHSEAQVDRLVEALTEVCGSGDDAQG